MEVKKSVSVRWQHLVALALVNLIVCDAQSASCSALQSVSATGSGEIVSHSGVGVTNYTNDLGCNWQITSPADSRLVARFTYIDLNVPNDYVAFFDGNTADTSKIINKITAANSSSYVSPWIVPMVNTMTMLFYTDFSITGKGFRLRYDVIPATSNKSCGAISYTNSSMMAGAITTGNGSQPYASNMSCMWTLPKISGYINEVTVTNMSLGDGDCLRLPTSSLLSALNSNNTICGPTVLTQLIIDTGDISKISFLSNNISEAAGFTIGFEYKPVTAFQKVVDDGNLLIVKILAPAASAVVLILGAVAGLMKQRRKRNVPTRGSNPTDTNVSNPTDKMLSNPADTNLAKSETGV